ncbi:helix-turn-helix domain-containing protein [Cellulomonas sp. P5_E12]
MEGNAVDGSHEPFVTAEDVAAYLDKPVSWIYNNAERQGMPRYRIGNQWRYRLSELDEWMRSSVV